jgi:hypothetical protein
MLGVMYGTPTLSHPSHRDNEMRDARCKSLTPSEWAHFHTCFDARSDAWNAYLSHPSHRDDEMRDARCKSPTPSEWAHFHVRFDARSDAWNRRPTCHTRHIVMMKCEMRDARVRRHQNGPIFIRGLDGAGRGLYRQACTNRCQYCLWNTERFSTWHACATPPPRTEGNQNTSMRSPGRTR